MRDLHRLVEQHRPLGVGLGSRIRDALGQLAGKLEPQLALRVLEHRAQLHELSDERAQPPGGGQARERERNCHARPGKKSK